MREMRFKNYPAARASTLTSEFHCGAPLNFYRLAVARFWPDVYVPSPGHAYPCDQGSPLREGTAAPPNRGLDGKSMTRRRLILSIVTAGCWIILLAIVLNSVFAASMLSRQSTQGQ